MDAEHQAHDADSSGLTRGASQAHQYIISSYGCLNLQLNVEFKATHLQVEGSRTLLIPKGWETSGLGMQHVVIPIPWKRMKIFATISPFFYPKWMLAV